MKLHVKKAHLHSIMLHNHACIIVMLNTYKLFQYVLVCLVYRYENSSFYFDLKEKPEIHYSI